MSTPANPRCINCGARWSTLDDDGLCQLCFVARGLGAMAELEHEQDQLVEPHRERVSGQRLAAVSATAVAWMPQAERALRWQECCQLLIGLINVDTHPELRAAIDALGEPVYQDTQASWWNYI